MTDLPILEVADDIVARLREHRRLILQAPTGSGKSTQVPQILLDHGLTGHGEVVVLQPRRLATRMLAARVAQERGVRLGEEVGYQIRFDNVGSAKTRIRFVTEGVLLRRMLGEPELRGISAILFDEFHERHLYGDITLARALDIQETIRPDLRLVVMSATLETRSVEKYLAPCGILDSQGRTFPVAIEYLPRKSDRPVWEQAADALERLARAEPEGDVLVFMPGAYEINRTIAAIRNSRAGGEFIVLPLHGELSAADQDAAVARHSKRKVVVSTNVAETSLTIDGIRIVIDSGLARIARFDPHRGINTLLVEKISRASADQRSGRAGRTAPGRCLRLWTELEHANRVPQELPEVRRLDLAEVVLTLKASGVEDIRSFRWLEPPDPVALDRAETLLADLGALHESAITELGREMLRFPMHPRYSRMLLAAGGLGCVRPVALIAALTQSRSILLRSEGKQMDAEREAVFGGETSSDFKILMRAWHYAEGMRFDTRKCAPLGIHANASRQVDQLFEQFLKQARGAGLDTDERAIPENAVERCILVGFSDHLAHRLDAGTLRCELVHGRRGVLARDSVVQKSELLVAADIREIQGRGGELTVLLSLATIVKEEWLRELFPDDFQEKHTAFYDATQRRVMARDEVLFRDLVLESGNTDKVPPDAAARLLAEQVASGKCPLKNWDNAVEQWIARLNCLGKWMPELGLPALSGDDRPALLEQICYGAISYREIKERPVWPTIKAWLSGQQQGWLEKFAPERIALPGGRKFKIAYSETADPSVSIRIQDLYGVEEDLRIANGRVTLVINVLAPNHRPIQVTSNLATFWRDAYPKIKSELQRRYPKHEWR